MKSTTVLTTLLKQAPENSRLTKFLPDSALREVQTEKSHANPLIDLSLKELLEKIDESWYKEKLETFRENDRSFYRSLFENAFPKPLELYFLNLFFQEFFPSGPPLPLSYLPDHSLSFLLQANKDQLIKLCFYLGLYDISVELKTVLKGSILKKLEESLLPDEIQFCRNLRNVFSLGPIGLNQWNEEPALLRNVIFERGLYRLSLGLCDASRDFIWYVEHTFPKEVSILLQKLPKPSMDSRTWGIILQQIITAWGDVCIALN